MVFKDLRELLVGLESGWRPATGELVMWDSRSAVALEEGWLVGDRLERWDDCSPLEFCESLPA